MKYESFQDKINKLDFNDVSAIIRAAATFIIITVAIVIFAKYIPFEEIDLNNIQVESEDAFSTFYVKSFIITFALFFLLKYISFFLEFINSILIFLENRSQQTTFVITDSDEIVGSTFDYNSLSKREKVINFISMISSACSSAVFCIVGLFFLIIGIGITMQGSQGLVGGIVVALMGLIATLVGFAPSFNNIMAYISQRTGKEFNPVGLKVFKRILKVLPTILGSLAFIGVGLLLIVMGVTSGLELPVVAVLCIFGLIFAGAGLLLAKSTLPGAIDEIRYGGDE